MLQTKLNQLYGFWSKIDDFLAVLRKITDSSLSYGLYLNYRWTANPYESKESIIFSKTDQKSAIFDQNP